MKRFRFGPALLSLFLTAPALAQQPSEAKAEEAPPPPYLTYGGSADFYFESNLNNPFTGMNALHAFDIFDERGPHLGLVDVWLQGARRPVGFRLDLDFGLTSRFINAFEPSGSNVWEHIGQAFVSVNLNKKGTTYLDVGKWATPAGAELIEPVDNWLYNRGLLFTLAVPFYHAGARVYHYFNATDYVMAHVNRGWNAVGNPHHGPGFGLSGAKTLNKRWSVLANYLGGEEPGLAGTTYRHLFDLVATHTPGGKWSFTHNVDVGHQKGATWYGLSSQARYSLGSRQYVTLRGEIYRDEGGLTTGADQTVGSATVGFAHRFHPRAQARVEYRHDFSGGGKPFPESKVGSFSSSQDTFLISTILNY
jgi:hypothetical protein